MTNTLFSIFVVVALLRLCVRWNWRTWVWMGVSVLAFAQVGQKVAPGAVALILIQGAVIALIGRFPRLKAPFLPLIYAAALLLLNGVLHLNIPGFSYLVLASSLDLGVDPAVRPANLGRRIFNLLSFPKTVVGPITGSSDLERLDRPLNRIFKVAFWGVFKAFILANLWRQYFPAPQWVELASIKQYFCFGLWNYVNLFLEFSGTCDLVAATFWLFGYDCPLNFAQPYLAVSVSDFWKRWHITLSRWIRDHVYIPFGGSRVPTGRILLNLMLAMCLSGLWHGLHWNYLAWGALQGLFLVAERLTHHEQRIKNSQGLVLGFFWLVTQTLVILSWVVFFAKF